MSFPDRRTVNILLTILLFSVVLGIAYVARAVIVVFCFGILFAYLIDPVVRFLQRHSLLFKNLRGPHVAEAYIGLLILIAVLFHTLAPGSLGRTFKDVQHLPALSDRLSNGEIATDVANQYGWSDSQAQRLKAVLVRHRSAIRNMTIATEQLATGALGAIVLIPILALFFLSSGEALVGQIIQFVSTSDNRDRLHSLASELHVMMQHYIRAKVILGGLSFAYASTALLILGFPHALALGLLAGILEFIPMAGWMIAATAMISVGIITHSHWIWMAVLLRDMANAHGLLDCSSGVGTRVGNTAAPGNIHVDDGCHGRRTSRSLSFGALCGCGSCHLAESWSSPPPIGSQSFLTWLVLVSRVVSASRERTILSLVNF